MTIFNVPVKPPFPAQQIAPCSYGNNQNRFSVSVEKTEEKTRLAVVLCFAFCVFL